MRFPNSPAMLESTRGIVWSAEWEIRNASGASTQWDHRPIVSAQSCSSACKDTTTSSSSSSSTISVPHLFSLTAAVRPPAPSPEDPPPAPPPWAFPCCRGIESCRWKLPTRPDPTPPPTPPPARSHYSCPKVAWDAWNQLGSLFQVNPINAERGENSSAREKVVTNYFSFDFRWRRRQVTRALSRKDVLSRLLPRQRVVAFPVSLC